MDINVINELHEFDHKPSKNEIDCDNIYSTNKNVNNNINISEATPLL